MTQYEAKLTCSGGSEHKAQWTLWKTKPEADEGVKVSTLKYREMSHVVTNIKKRVIPVEGAEIPKDETIAWSHILLSAAFKEPGQSKLCVVKTFHHLSVKTL